MLFLVNKITKYLYDGIYLLSFVTRLS